MKYTRLQLLRLSRGITQKQMADRLGLVQSYVSMIETGYFFPLDEELQKKIIKEYGITGGQLIEFTSR